MLHVPLLDTARFRRRLRHVSENLAELQGIPGGELAKVSLQLTFQIVLYLSTQICYKKKPHVISFFFTLYFDTA